MAQAGYTPISLYYSTTSTQEPTAGNLVSGELAINIADGKLFYKNSAGDVRLLSIGYGSSSVTPTNGGVQYGTGTALALTAAGSSGQILRSNGTAAPTWADLSTLGVNTISFGTTGLTPNSATAGAVTVAGTLVTANGGTGLGGATPFTANGVLYASSASALTSGSALVFDGTNLGIGTSSPSAKLQVNASNFALSTSYATLTDNFAIRTTDSQAANVGGMLALGGFNIGTSSASDFVRLHGKKSNSTSGNVSGYFAIEVADDNTGPNYMVERLRIDSSGNLGLGVTPSAWWSGSRTEQIGQGGILEGRTGSSVFAVGSNYFINSSIAYTYVNTGYATRYEQVNGRHEWFTAPSGTAGNAISFTQAMTLDASGRLGIGSTSPTELLTLASSNNFPFIHWNDSSNTNIAYMGWHGGSGGVDDLRLGTTTTKPITFYTNNTERARITSGGDLYVGNTTTSSPGDGNTTTGTAIQAAGKAYFSAATSRALTLNRNEDGNVASFFRSGSEVGSISVTTTATAFNTSSDYRLKDNPQPLTNSGAFIDALKPKTWNWKSDGSKGVGFIAHEVQEVSPGTVVGTKDAVDADGKPIMQAMEYGSAEFIANIIAELQSLRARVAQLEGTQP